jgi:hypothetical protein
MDILSRLRLGPVRNLMDPEDNMCMSRILPLVKGMDCTAWLTWADHPGSLVGPGIIYFLSYNNKRAICPENGIYQAQQPSHYFQTSSF